MLVLSLCVFGVCKLVEGGEMMKNLFSRVWNPDGDSSILGSVNGSLHGASLLTSGGDGVEWKYDTGNKTIVIWYTGSGTGVLTETSWGGRAIYKHVEVGAGVTSIPNWAFSGDLRTVTFHGDVDSIGDYAMYKQTLEKVVYKGTKAPTCGVRVFYRLTFETIPMQEVFVDVDYESDAFCGWEIYRCLGSCGATVSWFYDKATSTLTISGTGEMFSYSKYTMPWSSFQSSIQSVVVEEGVTSIGSHSFNSFNKITTVKFPSTLKSIGESAFDACSVLSNIEWPEEFSETLTIGTYAFEKCGFTNLVIPSKADLGKGCFQLCKQLTSISFCEGFQKIGEYAFCYCTSLSAIELPASVNSIGNYAFSSCKKPFTVEYFGKSDPGSGSEVFSRDLASVTVYVPHDYVGDRFCTDYGITRRPNHATVVSAVFSEARRTNLRIMVSFRFVHHWYCYFVSL